MDLNLGNNMNKIEKPWGWEEIVEKNDKYVVKKIFMAGGCQCSFQYHERKIETIIVLKGELRIITDKTQLLLKPFEAAHIPTGIKHRMFGVTDCLYLECSTPELDDVVRLEDDYDRA